jgi:hypothetical protein
MMGSIVAAGAPRGGERADEQQQQQKQQQQQQQKQQQEEDSRLANLSEPAKALICTLLQTNEHARWALARHDGLRSCRFFSSLDWAAMLARRVPAPVVPSLLGDADTRNFSHCSLAHVGLDEQVGVPLDAGALDTALDVGALEVRRSASEGNPIESLRREMGAGGGGGGGADLGRILDGCARPSKRAKEDFTSGDSSWEGF